MARDIEPRLKLWLEEGNQIVLSDYRASLLRNVRDTGSLAGAALRMGLSYRRAWGKVREIEANLGYALVVSDVGGAGGGKTRLTPRGERLLESYEAYAAEMTSHAKEAFARHFGGALGVSRAPVPQDVAPPALSRQAGEQVETVADNPVDAPAR
jgi:molybdate transport system regulatory protein